MSILHPHRLSRSFFHFPHWRGRIIIPHPAQIKLCTCDLYTVMLRYATVFNIGARGALRRAPLTSGSIRFVLLAIPLIAFLLRVFRLQVQSLWYDEAFSVYLARMNLGEITARTAADIQPPLYYYLLHFWMDLAGDSEFAVRFLSLLFGVLTVPLIFVTARRAFGSNATGIFAALLALLSPLYLWYSQETRMYSMITFLALLSSYALLRGIEGNPTGTLFGRSGEHRGTARRWWIAFSVANIAAVYTHYFAFVIIAFQVVYFLWQVLSSRSRQLGVGLVAFAATVVAFLPWLPFLLSRLGEDASYWRGTLKVDEAVRHIFINFTSGESVLEYIAQSIAAAWLLTLLAGLVAWVAVNRNNRRDAEKFIGPSQESNGLRVSAVNQETRAEGLAFSILYLVIPLALLLFLFYRNPKFNARYLMVASPGLILLLSAGLASLWSLAQGYAGQAVERHTGDDLGGRTPPLPGNAVPSGTGDPFPSAAASGRGDVMSRARLSPTAGRFGAGAVLALAVAVLFGTSLYADNNAYFDPAFTKADFRGVTQFIAANARNDEAIILTSGHMFPAFDYYFQDASLPELRLPDDPTLNTEHVLNYSAAEDLNRGVAGKAGAWLVLWQDDVADPNGFVPMLLSSKGQEQKVDASFWQIKLRHWSLPADARFSPQPAFTNAHPANFGNKVELLGFDSPNPTPADQGASFNLYFQSLDTLADDYNVALRIVDAQGNLWGKLDRRPSGYNYPSTRWKKGENLFGSYTVPLLPGAPAGDYIATATFFTAANQTGLDILASNGAPIGKSVKLGPVRVLPAAKPPAVPDLAIQHTLNTRVGPFTLLGYSLSRENASTGESIPITLFWRADQRPDADYAFQIRFGDKSSAALPLASPAFPTSQWRAGEIVRAQYLVQIPPDASAGAFDLQLNLSGANNLTADLLQQFSVEKTDRVFVAPNSQFKQDANFGNLVGLTGYDLSSPQIKAGDTLTVTLDWKALGKMDKAYTVFVHLLDKDSKVAAQKDSQPMNGARATPTWVEGEYLSDSYALALKPDVAPGEYRVEIGWYDAADPAFARLQSIDPGGNGTGDHVILGQAVTVDK